MSIEEAVHLADMDNLTTYRDCWRKGGRRLKYMLPQVEGDQVSGGGGILARLHSTSPATIYQNAFTAGGQRGDLLMATLLTDLLFRDKPETGYRDVFQPKDSNAIRQVYGETAYAYLVCIMHTRQAAAHDFPYDSSKAAVQLWNEHQERPETIKARLDAASHWSSADENGGVNPFLDLTRNVA